MMPEITVIEPTAETNSVWAPSFGSSAAEFLGRQGGLSDVEKGRVAAEAQAILAVCQPPFEPGRRTVLAVGRVQSGKTLSFEMLTALARDNQFGLVIIVAGISKFLEKQTQRRFYGDFGFDSDPQGFEKWLLISSSPMMSGNDQGMRGILESWVRSASNVAQEENTAPTVVVVTLKHHSHIDAVAKHVPADCLVPTLIIDDEADQASLNARARQRDKPATTTYRALDLLRGRLGSHTYVQYTATPQANFLLAAADTLAPDAVRLVTPGESYVGNEDFFGADTGLVRKIPDVEAGVFEKDVHVTEPPRSLLDAIDSFVVAAALVRHFGELSGGPPEPAQVSMLIHPDRLVAEHSKATRWVKSRVHLLGTLDDEALGNQLQRALSDFSSTFENSAIPVSMDEIVRKVRKTLQLLDVLVLNRSDEGWGGTEGEDIPWRTKYAWIVVGGQMVDRGLTIPGLLATYMPRKPGRNVDTVQQRARWLGYKRSYLDLCRLWLTRDSINFFSDCSEHELLMHAEVERIVTEGETLKSWRRRFLLDPNWQLTRSNVISKTMHKRRLEEWEPFLSLGDGSVPPATTDRDVEALIDYVRALPGFTTDNGYGHSWSDCTLHEAFEIVERYPVLDPADAEDKKALLLAHIARRIDMDGDSPGNRSRVYLMNDADEMEPRKRSSGQKKEEVVLKALLQGRNASYPGDRAMVRSEGARSHLTLQLHRVLPTRVSRGGPPLWPDNKTALVLAAYIPPGSDPGWVIETA